MPDRRTYLELLHNEMHAAAKSFANDLFEGISQGISHGLDVEKDVLRELHISVITPEEVVDLILPGFTAQVFNHLATLSTTAESGWLDVFFNNLAERYENEGGIET